MYAFSVPASGTLIAALNLGWLWVFVGAAAYFGIEELFLVLSFLESLNAGCIPKNGLKHCAESDTLSMYPSPDF